MRLGIQTRENNGSVAAGEYNSVGMAQKGNGLSRARLTVRDSLSEPTGEYCNENDDGGKRREKGGVVVEEREGEREAEAERGSKKQS
jgi:hypothetical protein